MIYQDNNLLFDNQKKILFLLCQFLFVNLGMKGSSPQENYFTKNTGLWIKY